MEFTLLVPQKVSLNTALRKHYAAVNTMKQEWYYVVLEAKLDKYTGSFPVDITYHYKLHGKAIDSSNAGFMSKALEDALVQNGIIPNDDPKYVRWSCNLSDKAEKGEPDTVTVMITS